MRPCYVWLLALLLAGEATAAAPSEVRSARYRPVGNGVEITDGDRRFNRALYGAHTGFRLECSDTPEFGLYLPRMGGNLRLQSGHRHCTARYEAGRMIYRLDNGVRIEAQVLRSTDAALWRIENTDARPVRMTLAFGGVADKRFHREGDLGVDDPDCFAFRPAYCQGNRYTVAGNSVTVEYGAKERARLRLTLPTEEIRLTEHPSLEAAWTLAPNEVRYLAVYPERTTADLTSEALPARFAEAEAQRAELARSLRMQTPDPYITPIGGALALAADGLWSGQAWLHGAIGWRTPYSGWRGAYAGDALGWHERARIHFDTYAANQIDHIEPRYDHPRQDSTLNLARAEKRWGTPMYSNGYITRRPGKRNEMSHYDMNLCYIDELLRHLAWTGDLDYARRIFPVIERHLAWEKRNFDPDGDHLYDAYCCIWASDALYYTAGAVTHSSAYNCYANRQAAALAELLGLDPTPYRTEAEAIQEAMNRVLWMEERGHWAEYRDFMGLRRLHTDAALWTIYHAIDSETADPFQAYAATRYVDTSIPHIPVRGEGIEAGYALPSTSDWKPYSWSINNVAIAEVMHTALAYWQAGRPEEAFRLMKSTALDNMYLGASPLNFGQISHYDAARGECYRDFGDPVGVWSRALVEGLYGIRPDRMHGRVTIRPGFPAAWEEAQFATSDLSYTFRRTPQRDTYRIEQHFAPPSALRLEVRARRTVARVTVDGKRVRWQPVEPSVGEPRIVIEAGSRPQATVEIVWGRALAPKATAAPEKQLGGTRFREVADGALRWWSTEEVPSAAPQRRHYAAGFDRIDSARCEPVPMAFNASVTDIFRNRYLSPRPPYTTLQLPAQGIGEWCHPKLTAEIDDSGLRSRTDSNGIFHSALGIPFRTPAAGKNILYTSLWDNYPDRASVALGGRATHAYLLLAGSTNHMQYAIANGVVRIHYTTGAPQEVELINPETWVPIEQDIYYDEGAFRPAEGSVPPYRLHFASGRISRRLGRELGLSGVEGQRIPGGAALLLDVALDPGRRLDRLEIETLSNDVVIGLMAVTLQRPSESRPFVRWWWLGSAVDREGLDYNLSEFARQGIGGVEITPIYGVKGNEANDLEYLSPAWMEAYRHTVERGRELGVQIDLSNCTGWPFGGPWVSTEQSAEKYILEEHTLSGGQRLEAPLHPADRKQQAVAAVEAVQAVSAAGERIELTERVQPDGRLDWQAPTGEWRLYVLYAGRTFQKVKRAAPGGEGYVLNHYNRSAVEHYLHRFDKAFAASGAPRPDTFFNDSFEVYNSDWDRTLLAEFEAEHGYRLQDYLPEFAAQGADERSARIVCDYRQTLAGMLLRNFTTVWRDWAHRHGSRVRNQAHGSPGNIFDFYAAVDIPECESFGRTDFAIPGLRRDTAAKASDADPAVLKFASSAAHVTGKRITSCETLTWLTEHFRTPLSCCKPELDQILASGVNHVYFHGAPYSPKGAKFPGWLFYASINLSPTAPLWEDAEAMFAYVTRCQEFLQEGEPDNDVLLYIPMADISHARQGRNLLLFDIHKMERTMPELKHLMNRIVRGGCDADYISDRYLTGARVDREGRIVTEGGARYRSLVLPHCRMIPPETLQQVLELAREGADILFLGGYPDDVPGFGRLAERRQTLRSLTEQLPAAEFGDSLAAPQTHPFGAGRILTAHAARIFDALDCSAPEGSLQEPLKRLGCQLIRRSTERGKRYFVSLLDGPAIDGWVTLRTAAAEVRFTDPLTGRAGLAAHRRPKAGATEVYLQLEPGQSILIETFDRPQSEVRDAWFYAGETGEAALSSGWSLSFPQAEPATEKHFALEGPRSWCGLAPECDVLCGTGRYAATFRVENPAAAERWILDLGDVRESARVRVNGHEAGIAWSLPFRIEVGRWLQAGENRIEIDVTNLPANRIAEMDRRGVEWRIFKNANITGARTKTLETAGWPVEPSGLNGEVRLLPVARKQITE